MKQGIFMRAQAEESTEQIVDIIGVIGWEVGYQTLRELIRSMPANTKSVLFDIYSPGGDVWEGNGIVQEIGELSKKGIKTSARVQVAASMATLIAVACEERTIAANGRFLIHNAWSMAQGDAAEMEKMAKTLRDCEQEAAKFYAERTGKKTEEMLALMAEDRWMMPEETMQLGFCKSICDPFKPEEYKAVKQEIVDAGKWPKSLVEMPVEQPKPQEITNAGETNNQPEHIQAAVVNAPVNPANDPGYVKGLAEGEKQRAEEQAKFAAQLAKRDNVASELQSAKDKAIAKVMDLEHKLSVASAESVKAKEAASVNLAAALAAQKMEHEKIIVEMIKKNDAVVTDLKNQITTLTNTLKDANDRNSKLISGAMTFEPTIETWEEAMKSCNNDYVTAAKQYPELAKQYNAKNKRK